MISRDDYVNAGRRKADILMRATGLPIKQQRPMLLEADRLTTIIRAWYAQNPPAAGD